MDSGVSPASQSAVSSFFQSLEFILLFKRYLLQEAIQSGIMQPEFKYRQVI